MPDNYNRSPRPPGQWPQAFDCGDRGGSASARLKAYYAGPGNRFWHTLHLVGLTPTELRPEDYEQLLRHGIGLTDLAKGASGADASLKPEDFDRLRLRAVVKTVSPHVIAFNGKNAAARFFGVPTKKLNYGRRRYMGAPPSTFARQRHVRMAIGCASRGRSWHARSRNADHPVAPDPEIDNCKSGVVRKFSLTDRAANPHAPSRQCR